VPRRSAAAVTRDVLPLSGDSIMLRSLAAFIVATPALLLVVGCGDSPSSTLPKNTTSSISGPNDQADVDNVALCFHKAVTVLQAEPDKPKDIATFMKDAKAVVNKFARDSGDADFNALRWNSDGTSLITRSGKPIRSRVAQRGHDNYGPVTAILLSDRRCSVNDSVVMLLTTTRRVFSTAVDGGCPIRPS